MSERTSPGGGQWDHPRFFDAVNVQSRDRDVVYIQTVGSLDNRVRIVLGIQPLFQSGQKDGIHIPGKQAYRVARYIAVPVSDFSNEPKFFF